MNPRLTGQLKCGKRRQRHTRHICILDRDGYVDMHTEHLSIAVLSNHTRVDYINDYWTDCLSCRTLAYYV